MSVFSDVEIIEGLLSGHVICRPLRPENIRGSSIDLTLGEWFWRCDADPGGVFNPYDEDEVKRYFAGPFQAKPYAHVYDRIGGKRATPDWPYPYPHPFKGIPEDWPVIVVQPRERLLCHSHEFAGIRSPGTSQMNARSTAGRLGLTVCKCAGKGDPGFFDRWTIEFQNENDEAIIVPVGERYAQLTLLRTGPTRESYGTETRYESKYQRGGDVDEIIERWSPYDMLPRSFKDERRPLLPLDAELQARAIDDLRQEARR